jgi:hypothetical protein
MESSNHLQAVCPRGATVAKRFKDDEFKDGALKDDEFKNDEWAVQEPRFAELQRQQSPACSWFFDLNICNGIRRNGMQMVESNHEYFTTGGAF